MKPVCSPAVAVVLTALAGVVSGCQDAPPRSHATAAQQAACTARADEVYTKQNRDEIYQTDRYVSSTRDAPFGSSGLIGVTSSGLSGRYERDNMLADCINGATSGSTPAAPGSSPDAPATGGATGAATGGATGAPAGGRTGGATGNAPAPNPLARPPGL